MQQTTVLTYWQMSTPFSADTFPPTLDKVFNAVRVNAILFDLRTDDFTTALTFSFGIEFGTLETFAERVPANGVESELDATTREPVESRQVETSAIATHHVRSSHRIVWRRRIPAGIPFNTFHSVVVVPICRRSTTRRRTERYFVAVSFSRRAT